jgi:hypothetical protein
VPVTYSIDADHKTIRTVCRRPLTIADVIGHFEALKNDPACPSYLDVLLDLSDADALPETNQLGIVNRELALVHAKVQFGVLAIIAPGDAMFGMMRMFEVHAGQHFRAIRVFRDSAQAAAWFESSKSGSSPK